MLLTLAGCGAGVPACPDAGTPLTYSSFGSGFMSVYCVPCHGPSRTEKGFNVSTLSLVQSNDSAIVSHAGTGSDMPPSDSLLPSATERAQLTEWISCGAP